MDATGPDPHAELNWTAVGALYAGWALGLAALLYGGDYRNAAWLALIGAGGGCSAYGRVLSRRGRDRPARWWHRGGALFYVAFFLWAGAVLLRTF
ncbi:MAG: hypothetical protein ABEL97_14425 [Salinibacter sp.]